MTYSATENHTQLKLHISLLQLQPGDISGHGNLFKVGLSDFESELVPSLTPHDCVVCIQGHRTQPELQRVMAR